MVDNAPNVAYKVVIQVTSFATKRATEIMTSKSTQAYQQIKQLIQEGQVPSGERLTEAKAASLVGMGRGPVRESMVRLEAEGFLKNRGSRRSRVVSYVEDQNPDEMLARYELREQIESGAARLAAKNMTGWQIDRLQEMSKQLEEIRDADEQEKSEELTGLYWQFILENCGNPLLMEIWKAYNLSPLRIRSPEVKAEIMSSIPQNEQDQPSFMEITNAIATHDSDLAETLLKKRIRRITEAIRKYVWTLKSEQELG